jgi:hypothetical protein
VRDRHIKALQALVALECGDLRRFELCSFFLSANEAEKEKESQRQSGGDPRTPKDGIVFVVVGPYLPMLTVAVRMTRDVRRIEVPPLASLRASYYQFRSKMICGKSAWIALCSGSSAVTPCNPRSWQRATNKAS